MGMYIIGNIKWMKFNFNFPTGNYELFYDRCTRNELTAMYFGEDGWEKYHACREPGSAEYKLRTLQGSGTKKESIS